MKCMKMTQKEGKQFRWFYCKSLFSLLSEFVKFLKSGRVPCLPGTGLDSRGQRAKWTCLHVHLATAARVKYPAALQRCKFDVPLLAAGFLTAAMRDMEKKGQSGCRFEGKEKEYGKKTVTGRKDRMFYG